MQQVLTPAMDEPLLQPLWSALLRYEHTLSHPVFPGVLTMV